MNKIKTFKSNIIGLTTAFLLPLVSFPAYSADFRSNTIPVESTFKIENNFFNQKTEQKLKISSQDFDLKNSVSQGTTIFGLPQNMGPVDRILRGVIAAGLIGTGIYGLSTGNISQPISYTLLGVSAVPIVTGASGYCPLYQLFGLDYSF